MDYLLPLKEAFEQESNPSHAIGQKAYLRNQFDAYGLKMEQMRCVSKLFLKHNPLPDYSKMGEIVKYCWAQDQREWQYFAMDTCIRYKKQWDKDALALFEWMTISKSWWDTVDLIATQMVGEYLKARPQELQQKPEEWIESDNIWLQRIAILHQLKYKTATNSNRLKTYCLKTAHSKEFFIQKAIGWALREYSKTDAEAVALFLQTHELKPLSHREGLKWIKKNKSSLLKY